MTTIQETVSVGGEIWMVIGFEKKNRMGGELAEYHLDSR